MNIYSHRHRAVRASTNAPATEGAAGTLPVYMQLPVRITFLHQAAEARNLEWYQPVGTGKPALLPRNEKQLVETAGGTIFQPLPDRQSLGFADHSALSPTDCRE
jgi:hypothetical protein